MISTDDALPIRSHSLGPAGLVTSLGLHALLLAGIVVFVRPAALPQAVEQVVIVELVTAPAPVPAAPASEAVVPVSAAEPEQADPDEPLLPPSAPDMIEATQMLAGAALADPRNAEARQMLGLIEVSLRREQVCGIEAMEQIKRLAQGWSPECVISYAFSETRLEGDTVIAEGAVVQSGPRWYRLAYECTLGTEPGSVTAFRYRIGDVVSLEDSDRLGLAPCM